MVVQSLFQTDIKKNYAKDVDRNVNTLVWFSVQQQKKSITSKGFHSLIKSSLTRHDGVRSLKEETLLKKS